MKRSRLARSSFLLPLIVFAWAFAPAGLDAQDPPADPVAEIKGETFEIPPGITETVDEMMERERLLPPYAVQITIKDEIENKYPKQPNPDAPAVPSWPPRERGAASLP